MVRESQAAELWFGDQVTAPGASGRRPGPRTGDGINGPEALHNALYPFPFMGRPNYCRQGGAADRCSPRRVR